MSDVVRMHLLDSPSLPSSWALRRPLSALELGWRGPGYEKSSVPPDRLRSQSTASLKQDIKDIQRPSRSNLHLVVRPKASCSTIRVLSREVTSEVVVQYSRVIVGVHSGNSCLRTHVRDTRRSPASFLWLRKAIEYEHLD